MFHNIVVYQRGVQMQKKGVEISISTIIVAAIALAVLVVLFAIFTGRLGSFSTGVSQTVSCENSCKALGMLRGPTSGPADKPECEGLNPKGTYIPGSYGDITSGVCCCLKSP